MDRRRNIDQERLQEYYQGDIIKYHHLQSGQDSWPLVMFTERTLFDSKKVNYLDTFKVFSNYLISRYDTLFIEEKSYGMALVTAISSTGIRIEYLEDKSPVEYEWIDLNMIGNDNATLRTFKPL